MDSEQEKLKIIYIGYHPRAYDGSPPLSRSRSDSMEVMNAFNQSQGEGRLRADVVEIAYTDSCAVAVMDTTINKVWQYI